MHLEWPNCVLTNSQRDRAINCAKAPLCYDAKMRRLRTTVTLDEDVLRWVRVRAARQGKGDSQVIEESLRRDLGLDLLERLWNKNRLDEGEAMRLAVEAQHRTRPRRRK
jgi:Ribbon-helix-helix protein, copG family